MGNTTNEREKFEQELKELREIYETRFHTIPHTITFGKLLNISENILQKLEQAEKEIDETAKEYRECLLKQIAENERLKEEIKDYKITQKQLIECEHNHRETWGPDYDRCIDCKLVIPC